MKKPIQQTRLINDPVLDRVKVQYNLLTDFNKHPFCLPIIKNLQEIKFPTKVTFFVGENGSGKSTILEAIAEKAGFGSEGGSRNINFKTSDFDTYTAAEQLADCFTLSWNLKLTEGYFFRAESFFNVANHIDIIAKTDFRAYLPYGGKSLHAQSHGESFLAFFQNRLNLGGFFIFDEPEAALSPQRQLALLAIINQLCATTNSQFIIATHSPILLAYPDATIYSCDSGTLKTISYKETDHYQISKRFLDDPELYLQRLFED